MTQSDTADEAKHARRQHRKRRRRKAGLWSLLSMAALVLAGTLLVLSYLGTPITVPDWLRTRITDRINESTQTVQVDLGGMAVVVEEGWKPRLSLRDVVLRAPDGTQLAQLSELGGRVAMEPLLRGEVQVGSIRLSGLQLMLRRDKAGSVDVALGGPGVTDDVAPEAVSLASIITQIDDALRQPGLSDLSRIDADNLTLRYEDARAGRAWTVDGGQITLTLNGDDLRVRCNFALLGARAYATTL